MPKTRYIPEEIKRSLRREAYFGCCRCGRAIFQYHHILGFAKHQDHSPDDLMILCLECHDLANSGIIPEEEQRAWKRSPHNSRHKLAMGQIVNRQDYVAIDIGNGVLLAGDCVIIKSLGEEIMRFERNPLSFVDITLSIHDCNGFAIGRIDRNEWVMDGSELWDFKYDWHYIRLSSRDGRISFSMDSRSQPMKLRLRMMVSDTEIVFSDDKVVFSRRDNPNDRLEFEDIGLLGLRVDYGDRGFSFGPARESSQLIVGETLRARLYKCREAIQTSRRSTP